MLQHTITTGMGEGLKRRLKQQRFDDSLTEAMLNLLVAAGHVRERLERFCADHGITHSQYNVLRILRGVYPDGHPRCEIAARMIERAPDVTRLIDRLEKQGYAERVRSAKDRRLSLTRITKKGLNLLEKIHPDEQFRLLSRRISTKDRKELSRICENLYSGES